MTDDKPRIEFNWVQASAASLAAVTSAVLLSTFGVAGTLIGAAVGSLALTVGNAMYSYSINATKHRVATAHSVAAARIGLARARASATETARTEQEPAKVREDPGPAHAGREDHPNPAADGRWSMLAALPWKRIALVSTGVFMAAMLMILVFESVTGRAVSSFTGSDDRRNSIPGWGDGSATERDPSPPVETGPTDQESGTTEDEATPPSEAEPTADSTLPASPTDTAESSPGSTVPSPESTQPSPDSIPPSPDSIQPSPTPSG